METLLPRTPFLLPSKIMAVLVHSASLAMIALLQRESFRPHSLVLSLNSSSPLPLRTWLGFFLLSPNNLVLQKPSLKIGNVKWAHSALLFMVIDTMRRPLPKKARHQVPKAGLSEFDGATPWLEPIDVECPLEKVKFGRSLWHHTLLKAGVVELAEHRRYVFELAVNCQEIHNVLIRVFMLGFDVPELPSQFVDLLNSATFVIIDRRIVKALGWHSITGIHDMPFLREIRVDDLGCLKLLVDPVVVIFSVFVFLLGFGGFLGWYMNWCQSSVMEDMASAHCDEEVCIVALFSNRCSLWFH
jgi:hypothetical protein